MPYTRTFIGQHYIRPDDAENVVRRYCSGCLCGYIEAFRAWIFRILSNKCNRKIREYVKRRETEAEKSIDDMAEMLSSRDNSMEQVENQTLVQKAFSVLSEEEKEIVTLTIYGEYDSGEVAGIMKSKPKYCEIQIFQGVGKECENA
jgi:hypothetical protein